MKTGQLNETWGKTLIDQLIRQGVTYFCHAPGFRSTPLALAIANDERAETFVHFDERGATFHALGYAKATGKPAAVLVTSGTALGNLMPAVMEAWAANIPLLLLTCDRPAELRDTCANQTGDQIKIFGDYVRYFFDFPSPNESLPSNFIATTVAQAVSKTRFPSAGPVQLNCPFPEPFFSNNSAEIMHTPVVKYFHPTSILENAKEWAEKLQGIERGVIVLGGNGSCQSVTQLSQKLGWPILPDIISSHREKADEQSISYYHHILKSNPDLDVDCILHLGDACVSKILLQWMPKAKQVIHVALHAKRNDPLHIVKERVICDLEHFCNQISTHLQQKPQNWIEKWKEWGKLASPTIEGLSEPGVIKVLESITSPSEAIFFGNSMPIRDADMFFFPQKPCGPIFANRGLSGIDGNIATIAGIAHKWPVTAVIGDQTLLHDLNSLVQLKKTKHPVRLIVINNGGGGIFSFVAIGERKDVLDPFFAAAHEMSFEKAASFFGLSYAKVETLEELEKTGAFFIEVVTNREENLKLHKQIDQEIQCSFSCTVS